VTGAVPAPQGEGQSAQANQEDASHDGEQAEDADAGVAIGLVQLDSVMVADDDGSGLEEAEVTGTAAGVAT